MNVAVLGSGAEGRDITYLAARAGHTVSLHAEDATEAMDRVDDIERNLADDVSAGEISERAKDAAVDVLEATTDLESALSDTEVVLDTATANTEQLQEQFAEIESAVDRETLVSTTESEIAVTAAAAGLRHPDRGFGFNFLDLPAAPVVELVIADQNTEEQAQRAESFIEGLDATPVRVRDAPGVASTRLKLALELEAMRTVEEGIAGVEDVDTLLRRGYQFSQGPLERADRAGLDSRLETLERLSAAIGPRFEPPDILRRLVEAGRTGAATGKGFYLWESGDPDEPAVEGPDVPARDGQFDDPAHR